MIEREPMLRVAEDTSALFLTGEPFQTKVIRAPLPPLRHRGWGAFSSEGIPREIGVSLPG